MCSVGLTHLLVIGPNWSEIVIFSVWTSDMSAKNPAVTAVLELSFQSDSCSTMAEIPLRTPLTKSDTNALLPPSNNYTSRFQAAPDTKRSKSYLTLSLRAQSIGEKLTLLEHLYATADADVKAGGDIDMSLSEDLKLFRNELKMMMKEAITEKQFSELHHNLKVVNSELEAKDALLEKKCELLNEKQKALEQRENQMQEKYSILVDALSLIANNGKLIKE
jgi:hypothetical protein